MSMQMRKFLPWIVSLPLRLAGLAWPLIAEVLALLWWGGAGGVLVNAMALVLVVCYLYLSLAPNRLIFSKHGFFTSLVLIGAALSLVIASLSSPEGVPAMAWVHGAFGIAWVAAIWLVRATEKD